MRAGWVLVALVVAGLGAATVASPAPAHAQAPAGVRLEVGAGYGGSYLVGRRLPVHVTVHADRLVQGTLEVTLPGHPGAWTTDLEVPGGGVDDVVVVVPTPTTTDVQQVQVHLTGAGEGASTRVELEALVGEELVGLLPEVTPPDLPEALALPFGAGTARFVALDTDELTIAGVLDPLGTVVAGPDEIGRLAAAARANVLDWVDRGGRLVVDANAGSPVAGVPDPWQPGADGRQSAGLGEVRAAGGAAAAGRWSEVVEPTPTVSMAHLLRFGPPPIAQNQAIGAEVARDAGLEALDVPWLLAFTGVYVALAGPVAFLALRRRRALGWVVVPGLAAVFSVAAFVIGSDLRSGTTAAHATVLETGPAGTRATIVVGLVSRNGNDGEVAFGEGWTVGSTDATVAGFFGQPTGGGPRFAVHSASSGTEVGVPLAAGGFGTVRASGLLPFDGALVVQARSVGDDVIGTVTNQLPFAVEQVGVLVGRDGDRIGRIEPGEDAEFRVEGRELDQRDPWAPPEASVWPGEAGYGPQPVVGSPVNLPIWNEAHLALGPNSRPRGIVTAVGWTRAFDGAGDVRGEGDPPGRTAVVGRAAVVSPDGTLAPGAAHRELVRGPEGTDLPDDRAAVAIEGSLFRFALPDGTGARPLAVDIPGYVGRLDAWDGQGWVTVDDSLAGAAFVADPFGIRTADLPATASADGVVWLRAWLRADFGIAPDGAGLDIREPA